ncbi:MAG: helix-turn-helix transcriptional regulator, partial [Lentisphaeria bacterium]|nr:helix-turn-helix transcriptional regulator [Lentisphaeria bacterium]
CWLTIHQLILTAGEHIVRKGEESMLLNANISRIMKAVSRIRLLPVPLSLEEAAQASSLSVSRFSSLFHSVMGISYGKFALRVRLGNAANDIKSGLYTLNEIAFRNGFCDASSLCNAFKKVYHCTPAQFKLKR